MFRAFFRAIRLQQIPEFLSVTISAPMKRRRLESDEAMALRTPLAALLKFASALRNNKAEVGQGGVSLDG